MTKEIKQKIELAQMMVADLDKIFKKYAKAALAAAEARAEKIRQTKYMGCENPRELQDLYGFGDMSQTEYEAGLDFFREREVEKSRQSLIELHRKNVKELRDRWKGTVIELQDELDELNGVEKGKPLTFIEQLEAKERQERYQVINKI